MSNQIKVTNSIMDHPLLLTTIVLYTTVLSLPLSKFPPVSIPVQSDLFIAGVVLMLLSRIAFTFYFASSNSEYPSGIFLLEVAVAGIFAWQFRVLLNQRVDEIESPLWFFYLLQMVLIFTMFFFDRYLSLGLSRYTCVLRGAGLIACSFGLIDEHLAVGVSVRMNSRWVVGVILLILPILYALRRPCRRYKSTPKNTDTLGTSHPQNMLE